MSERENNPIIIGMYIGKWVGGGVEAVVMNYYRHIDRNKIQFDFICDEDSTNIPYSEIENLGGKVIIVPPYQKLFKFIHELENIFKENNYNIVHSNVNTLSVFPLYAAYKAGVPIRIAHAHSTSNKREFKRNIIKKILKPLSKLYATNYFACSETAGRWQFGNKTYENGEVTVINNAIELNKFKFNQKLRIKKRKELNIKPSTLVIGHIGRFVKTKNHKFLIDMFSEIHKKNNDSVLILIGQGPLKEEIENKVNELCLANFVKFLGQRDDVNELYQAMDVFLLPSLYEGLGMVLIESQASGLYSIASSNIPKSATISNLLKYEKLNKKLWINRINIIDLQYDRQHIKYFDNKSKFDIDNLAKELEKKYIDLVRRLNRNESTK